MNFPFICRNIPVYSVYISRLIWYCRASDYFDNFMYRWLLFMQKLLNQAFLVVQLKSSLRNDYGRSLTNTLDVIHIKHNVCLFHTEYVLYTIYHDVFSRVYRRVWRYQRGNQNPYNTTETNVCFIPLPTHINWQWGLVKNEALRQQRWSQFHHYELSVYMSCRICFIHNISWRIQ
jgi:hypothetical protein